MNKSLLLLIAVAFAGNAEAIYGQKLFDEIFGTKQTQSTFSKVVDAAKTNATKVVGAVKAHPYIAGAAVATVAAAGAGYYFFKNKPAKPEINEEVQQQPAPVNNQSAETYESIRAEMLAAQAKGDRNLVSKLRNKLVNEAKARKAQ